MSYWGTHQPPALTAIDPASSLATGLVCALLPSGTVMADSVVPSRSSGTASTSYSGTYGTALGDWTISSSAISDLLFTSGDWSVAALYHQAQLPGNGEYPAVVGQSVYVNETNNQGWGLHLRSNDDAGHAKDWSFYSARNNASYPNSNLVFGPSTIGDHLIVGTAHPAGNRSLYIDSGVAASITALNTNPVSSAGNLVNAAGGTTTVPIYVAYFWSRLLTTAEITLLVAEPYAPWASPSTAAALLMVM